MIQVWTNKKQMLERIEKENIKSKHRKVIFVASEDTFIFPNGIVPEVYSIEEEI